MKMNQPLLSIRRLSKSFGGLKAVDGVDIDVAQGEILSIIGPNGSGKTTLFNLISGIYVPDEGAVELCLNGQNQGEKPPLTLPSPLRGEGSREEKGEGDVCVNLVGLSPYQIREKGISRTFQNIRLFANMTVLENIMVGQHCRTKSGPFSAIFKTAKQRKEELYVIEQAQRLLGLYRMLPLMNELAKSLSYADRKRLEILRALASYPKVLLLDEPAAGMNPHETRELMDDLKRLRDMGYTLMVIEHDMMMVKGLSDRVIAFDYGKKIAEGTFDQVRHNELVIEAYLGRKRVA